MALVSVEAHGEVAVVRMDRPPANAMGPDLLEEAAGVLDAIEREEPAAVVLTGRPGFFSAGADLKLVPTLDAAGQRRMVEGINRMASGWYGLMRPVVAAVNGHAIAGGMVLALCADHRVGATEGRYGLTEVAVSVPYPVAAAAVVRAELGPAAARRAVLGAQLVGPEEGLALGFFDELAAADDVLPRALAVAAARATLPRRAFALAKEQLRAATLAQIARDAPRDPLLGDWTG
jgi:enoyl-CoA hydratase/carnithine racemase